MKRAHTVALVAALYLASNTPAYSQDIFGFIQNIAGRYALSWTDLEARRTQMETEINTAVAGGKISAAQANDFRTELARITTEINTAKATGKRLGVTQSINFSNQINLLANSLGEAIQNKISTLPDVDAMQAQLKTQIDTALQAGQISAATATELKDDLNRIATMEAAYKVDTGATLTPRQLELLGERLNVVKGKVDQQIKIGQSAIPALNERRNAIDTKITQAVGAGKMTAGEAATFRTELTSIAAQQTSFQGSSGGVLTGSQVLALAQKLDQLDDQISVRLGTFSPGGPVAGADTTDLDALRARIGARINQLVASGMLRNAAAAELLHDLDQVSTLEQAYQAAVGGITVAQVTKLRGDLRDLNARIDERVAVRGDVSTGPIATLPGGSPTAGGGGWRGGGRRGGGRPGRGGSGGAGGADADVNTRIELPVIGQRSFTDVKGYWGEPYVLELASRDVIGGFPNGTFAPNDDITRAQFAAIVVKALQLPAATSGKVFTDVPANHWAAGAIATASNAGLIGGFPDGTFKPSDKITRAQALVILSKALGDAAPTSGNALQRYTDSNAVPSWAQQAIETAANANIIVSFPDASTVRPNETATRGEVAGLMYQTLSALGANLPKVSIGLR